MNGPDSYLQLEYPFRVEPDPEGGFVASIPDLPGCYASGMTKLEAVDRLEESRVAWLESYHAMHGEAPEPGNAIPLSGRILLRLPKYLHRKLYYAAKEEGVSLNQYLVALLAGGAAGAELARAGSPTLRLGPAGSRRRAGNEHGSVSAAISTGNAGKTGALRKYGERRAGGLRISEKAGKSRKESRRRKSISGRRHLS